MFKKTVLVSIASLCFTAAQAAEFKGEGGLGLTLTDGNTETENLNASLTAKYISGKFTNNFGLFANKAESNDVETADSVKFTYKLDYNLDDKNYIWAGYSNDANPYAGYDPQEAITVGYGRTFIKNDKTLFTGEIGFGTKDTDAVTGTQNPNGSTSFSDAGSSDESITHLALNYENKLSSNTQFIQKLLLQLGEDNDYTESFSALKVAMSDQLSLQLSYLIKKNSDIVGSNGDDTDTTTAVTVVYGF